LTGKELPTTLFQWPTCEVVGKVEGVMKLSWP